MNAIVLEFKENEEFQLVFHSDDICRKCPNLSNSGKCKTQKKVDALDMKTITTFCLEEKIYKAEDILRKFRVSLTREKMIYICNDCERYESGSCENEIFKHLD